MDWLTKYNAQIDCKSKKVTVRSANNVKVVFTGQKQSKELLTSIQMRKLLKQGCEAYLAYVRDINKEIDRKSVV